MMFAGAQLSNDKHAQLEAASRMISAASDEASWRSPLIEFQGQMALAAYHIRPQEDRTALEATFRAERLLESVREIDELLYLERLVLLRRLQFTILWNLDRARESGELLAEAHQIASAHRLPSLFVPLEFQFIDDLMSASLWTSVVERLDKLEFEVMRVGSPGTKCELLHLKSRLNLNLGAFEQALNWAMAAAETPGLGRAERALHLAYLADVACTAERCSDIRIDATPIVERAVEYLDLTETAYDSVRVLMYLAGATNWQLSQGRTISHRVVEVLGGTVSRITSNPYMDSEQKANLHAMLQFAMGGEPIFNSGDADIGEIWHRLGRSYGSGVETDEMAICELLSNLIEVDHQPHGGIRQMSLRANVEPVLERIFHRHSEALGSDGLLELLEVARSCHPTAFLQSSIVSPVALTTKLDKARTERMSGLQPFAPSAGRVQGISVNGRSRVVDVGLGTRPIAYLPELLGELPSATSERILFSLRDLGGRILYGFCTSAGKTRSGVLNSSEERALRIAETMVQSWRPEPTSEDRESLAGHLGRQPSHGEMSLLSAYRATVGPMFRDPGLSATFQRLASKRLRKAMSAVMDRPPADLGSLSYQLGRALPSELVVELSSRRSLHCFLGLDGQASSLPWALAQLPSGGCLGEVFPVTLLPSIPEVAKRAMSASASEECTERKHFELIDPSGLLGIHPNAHPLFIDDSSSALNAAFDRPGCRGILSLVSHIEWTGQEGDRGPSIAMGVAKDGSPVYLSGRGLIASRSLNVPDRVYLGGCAGVGLGVGEEWRGAALCFLLAGARHVIAPIWPIFQSEGANRMDAIMTDVLRIEDSAGVAEGLRARFTESLRLEREGNSNESPHYWAGMAHLYL